MNHFALFDTLYLGSALQSKRQDFSRSEVQVLSYLACLLFMYDGRASSEWGYRFTKNESGSPSSGDISNSIRNLSTKELLQSEESTYYRLTNEGVKFFTALNENIGVYGIRKKYLDAASNCTSVIPYGLIQNSLNKDPVLKASQNRMSSLLLSENDYATNLLHSQFKDLKVVINNEYESLIIPALTWLSGNINQQIG